ncbi:hypothetical protein ACE0DR_28470 [Azotobacter sp. CWF10]
MFGFENGLFLAIPDGFRMALYAVLHIEKDEIEGRRAVMRRQVADPKMAWNGR